MLRVGSRRLRRERRIVDLRVAPGQPYPGETAVAAAETLLGQLRERKIVPVRVEALDLGAIGVQYRDSGADLTIVVLADGGKLEIVWHDRQNLRLSGRKRF